MTRAGIGGHQSAKAQTTTWLTPPHVIEALGGADSFDLDPCAFEGSPIRTARNTVALPDDGLAVEWFGRVWLNPPYSTGEIDTWLERIKRHGVGTSLIFARTETEAFHRFIWNGANALLFLAGRLHFHRPDGTRAAANAGAPSVLCAYGKDDADRLAASSLPGAFTPLRFARFVLVAGLADMSWRECVLAWVRRQHGPVSVSDAYRHFARHPKAASNPNWRAKVRQTLQRAGLENVGLGQWAEPEAVH
jgi:hypothetical protein